MPTDEQIATAFNAGYTMQDKEPDMLENFIATENNANEIIEALTLGAKQFQKEKIIEQQQANKARNQNKTHKR